MQSYKFANIVVFPFIGIITVKNPYIFQDGTHVINVSLDWREEVRDYVEQHGGTYDWIPLHEEPHMEVDNLLKAVELLAKFDKPDHRTIVHCVGGNNRSRTVVEAYHFAKLGTHYEDEYKGFPNHLIYNCASGYLPPLQEMEDILKELHIRKYST